MTWTMAGYALWSALFHPGANIILVSRGETEASEMLDYCRFIHSQLPNFLKLSKRHDQSTLMSFPTVHSKIRALPATAEAGIGLGGATLIILDEFDFHDKDEQNYAEIKPMIDAGGQMVILSAPNKYDTETKFKEVWLRAKSSENNFSPLFFGYDVMPERGKDWYETQKCEYDRWELEGRYPKTEAEALSAPQLVCRFDIDAVQDLKQRCESPLREEQNGIVKIYQEPMAGTKYMLVLDPSEGDYDPSAGMVVDHWLHKVAEFHGKIPLDEQAKIGYDFYTRYLEPYTAVERNASGLNVIRKLTEMGVSHWHYYDKKKEKAGWWTSGSNRPAMIVDLADAVFHRAIYEPNPDALTQFETFIRTKKKPEGEARKGTHDEYPMMWGIALQIRKHMSIGKIRIRTYAW